MIKINMSMPDMCEDCPCFKDLTDWEFESNPHYVCGVTNDEIPWLTAYEDTLLKNGDVDRIKGRSKRLDTCPLIED